MTPDRINFAETQQTLFFYSLIDTIHQMKIQYKAQ